MGKCLLSLKNYTYDNYFFLKQNLKHFQSDCPSIGESPDFLTWKVIRKNTLTGLFYVKQ